MLGLDDLSFSLRYFRSEVDVPSIQNEADNDVLAGYMGQGNVPRLLIGSHYGHREPMTVGAIDLVELWTGARAAMRAGIFRWLR